MNMKTRVERYINSIYTYKDEFTTYDVWLHFKRYSIPDGTINNALNQLKEEGKLDNRPASYIDIIMGNVKSKRQKIWWLI